MADLHGGADKNAESQLGQNTNKRQDAVESIQNNNVSGSAGLTISDTPALPAGGQAQIPVEELINMVNEHERRIKDNNIRTETISQQQERRRAAAKQQKQNNASNIVRPKDIAAGINNLNAGITRNTIQRASGQINDGSTPYDYMPAEYYYENELVNAQPKSRRRREAEGYLNRYNQKASEPKQTIRNTPKPKKEPTQKEKENKQKNDQRRARVKEKLRQKNSAPSQNMQRPIFFNHPTQGTAVVPDLTRRTTRAVAVPPPGARDRQIVPYNQRFGERDSDNEYFFNPKKADARYRLNHPELRNFPETPDVLTDMPFDPTKPVNYSDYLKYIKKRIKDYLGRNVNVPPDYDYIGDNLRPPSFTGTGEIIAYDPLYAEREDDTYYFSDKAQRRAKAKYMLNHPEFRNFPNNGNKPIVLPDEMPRRSGMELALYEGPRPETEKQEESRYTKSKYVFWNNAVIKRTEADKDATDDELIERAVDASYETIDLDEMFPDELTFDVKENGDFYNYARDWQDEKNRDKLKEKYSKTNLKIINLKMFLEKIKEFYKKAYIPLESQYIDEHGHIRYSERVERAIDARLAKLGLGTEYKFLVFRQVIKAIGFSPDMKDLFLKTEKGDFKMYDAVFIAAIENLNASELSGATHPYKIVNRGMIYGKTYCFPIGIIDKYEAEILTQKSDPSGYYHGKDPYKLREDAGKYFLNKTLPEIKANTLRSERGQAQLKVIENQVRAYAALSGVSPRLYGVSDVFQKGYEEYKEQWASITSKPNPDKWDEEVSRVQNERADRARRNLDKRQNRTKRYYSEDVKNAKGEVIYKKGTRYRSWHDKKIENANEKANADMPVHLRTSSNPIYTEIRDPYTNRPAAFLMTTTSLMRFSGVFGNVPIMASGIIEHAQGNLLSYISNRILFAGAKEYKPTDLMYSRIREQEGIEAVCAVKAVFSVGGMDALMLFRSAYKQMNKENAKKFLEEYVNRKMPDGKISRKAKALKERMDNVAYLLMPGDIGFQKQDAMRWLEGVMLNYKRMPGERGWTAEQVQEMIETDGIQAFVAAAVETDAGRDSLLMLRNQTLDRISPISHAIDVILRSNCVVDFAITRLIDTYFKYGLNLIQLMLPFSNTLSYLAVRGINMKRGGINDTSQLDFTILDYQMGGHDSFGYGLLKNFLYDAIKLGNITLITGLAYFLIEALGFDEPPEEGLVFNWEEYRIGKNVGWGPDGNGIPVYAAWWLNDLTMFGLPAAYAFHVAKMHADGTSKFKNDDPDVALKIFKGGCMSMISGCSLLDMIKLVNNAERDFKTFEEMTKDPNVNQPPDWISCGLLQAELFCAKTFDKIMPAALTNWITDTAVVGTDAYAKTAYKVYDTDSNVPGKTEDVKSYTELVRRIEAQYNPYYGIWCDIFVNQNIPLMPADDKTGYTIWEMPVATGDDQRLAESAAKYDIPNEIPGGEENRIPFQEEKIDLVINDIKEKYNWDVDAAIADGMCIPWKTRQAMVTYLKAKKIAATNIYNQKLQNHEYANSVEKNQLYTEMSNTLYECNKLIQEWCLNYNIPYTSESYARLLTDYMTIYRFKNTNKPATEFDYWKLGDEAVEKIMIPKGNHPTSLFPFTTPDYSSDERVQRGYNAETVPVWYDENRTDLDKIFKEGLNATVPYGRDAGVNLDSAIFGGELDTESGGNPTGTYRAEELPTMGYRAYVPYDEQVVKDTIGKLKEIKDEDIKATDTSFGELGVYKDKSSWSKSSYPNWSNQTWPVNGIRRYTSGGGSSYSPRIYNNPRSISADRAATMYTKTPYSASSTYLRPTFVTKGSREAYKRQDI